MKKSYLLNLGILCCFFVACSGGQSQTDPAKDPQVNQQQVTPQSTESDYVPEPVDPKNAGTPTQAIKGLDAMVEGYQLGQDITPEQKKANTQLKKKIIRGTFDIKELCRLSLGKHWNVLTESQHKRFVDLMTELLETKAIFSKEQLQGQNKLYRILYDKENYDDPEKKTATVYTKMDIPKEKITLAITYKLLLTNYGWKIFDVIVDDASLLTNYKFQFDRIITENGFDELINRMNEKLKKIVTPKV